MRIAMVASDFLDTGHGGVEMHVHHLSRALVDLGHDVQVVRASRRDQRPLADEITVPYHVLQPSSSSRRLASGAGVGGRLGLGLELLRRAGSGLRSRWLLDGLLDRTGPIDLLHQHDFIESLGLAQAAAKRGIPVVWTNHLGEFLYLRSLPGGRRVLRWLTSPYRAAIAPSAELADASAISPPVHRLPNGVDTVRFRPCHDETERAQLRSRLGWGAEPVILVPRRWAPPKGVIFAAQAMSLTGWPSSARVVFVGSGTVEYPRYGAAIASAVACSGRPSELHRHVGPDEMAAMLRAADLTLIPSLKEATSLSALESMASGTAVVASSVGGLPEILQDNETGYLHEPASPPAICAAVRRALDDPRHDRVVHRALEVAKLDFSWAAIARGTEEIYRSVVQ